MQVMSVGLSIEHVNKSFTTPEGEIQVLRDLHMEVKRGEFIAVIGPSGCGKSTLLKIIAGLDGDYEGVVKLEERIVRKPGADRGFIFQEHRLFPWMTVERNIAADLSLKEPAIRAKVDKLIELVRLKGFERSFPRELSGGMSQRVSIARALLRDPNVLLLDEPFGALDAFTRAHMQEVMLEIWQRNKMTMILVTHDIDEAVVTANRIVMMNTRPGGIRKVISVELPYPRNRVSPLFQELRRVVLSEFEPKAAEGRLVDRAGI